MDKLNNFYKNKKVFVTGHTGFKGSWLVNTLLFFGSKVYGYSLQDPNIKHYKKFCDYKKVHNFYGDILDYNKLRNVLNKTKPEIIFHLAAQSLVSESFKKPKLTIATNFNGTLNIIEIAKRLKSVKSIVLITSDKCYQNFELSRGYKEEDRLGGDDPYSASKAAVEIIFNSYIKSELFNLKKYGIATARAGNVIGGGDWSKNRIIPDCVRSIINNKKLFIRNLSSTRPWQHVLEPISGYLLLGKKLFLDPIKYSTSYNFGPSNKLTLSVKELINLFFKEIAIKKKIFRTSGKFKESKLLKLNSNKSKNKLNWKNTWDMNQSIKETASWYKNYLEKKLISSNFTLTQIRRYFND